MDSDDVGCNGVVAVAVAVKRKFVSYLPFSIGHKSEMNTKFETIFLFVHCFVVVVVLMAFLFGVNGWHIITVVSYGFHRIFFPSKLTIIENLE